jgi:hypothetical protein
MPLDILNVVKLRCKRIVDVNDDDFPVGLAFVEEGHDAEDFDLLYLARVADLFADLADVERVIVAFCFCFGVRLGGVFPGLAIEHNDKAHI